jgi:hypothetical protein
MDEREDPSDGRPRGSFEARRQPGGSASPTTRVRALGGTGSDHFSGRMASADVKLNRGDLRSALRLIERALLLDADESETQAVRELRLRVQEELGRRSSREDRRRHMRDHRLRRAEELVRAAEQEPSDEAAAGLLRQALVLVPDFADAGRLLGVRSDAAARQLAQDAGRESDAHLVVMAPDEGEPGPPRPRTGRSERARRAEAAHLMDVARRAFHAGVYAVARDHAARVLALQPDYEDAIRLQELAGQMLHQRARAPLAEAPPPAVSPGPVDDPADDSPVPLAVPRAAAAPGRAAAARAPTAKPASRAGSPIDLRSAVTVGGLVLLILIVLWLMRVG